MKPHFSILLPTRNRAGLAAQSIDSVLQQAFGGWQLIIADNSDRGVDLESRYANQPGITYLRPKPSPLPMWENWQRAFEVAVGQFVLVLNDKCRLARGALETLAQTYPISDLTTWKIRWPRTTGSAVRIRSMPGARQTDYSATQVFEHLWRHWDRSDVFPHGVNMMFRREAFRDIPHPLFLPTCPDYVGGARLLLKAGVVRHLDSPITLIPRDIPATFSTGASVKFGLPQASEYMGTLPPGFSVLDPTFPSGYVAADMAALGVPPPLGSLEISHTRHTLERLAAGRGIAPSVRGQLGSLLAPRRVLPAVGDLISDFWRRRCPSGTLRR